MTVTFELSDLTNIFARTPGAVRDTFQKERLPLSDEAKRIIPLYFQEDARLSDEVLKEILSDENNNIDEEKVFARIVTRLRQCNYPSSITAIEGWTNSKFNGRKKGMLPTLLQKTFQIAHENGMLFRIIKRKQKEFRWRKVETGIVLDFIIRNEYHYSDEAIDLFRSDWLPSKIRAKIVRQLINENMLDHARRFKDDKSDLVKKQLIMIAEPSEIPFLLGTKSIILKKALKRRIEALSCAN